MSGPRQRRHLLPSEVKVRGVRVPDGTRCCGLTWITTGQLGTARGIARRTATALAPAVRAGTPVVGLEPRCTAALKTDLPELLDGDADAAALAGATLTLAELLLHRTPGRQPPRVDARAGRPAPAAAGGIDGVPDRSP